MSAPQQQQPQTLLRGIVKQVLSGDTVVIRGPAKNGPPKERTLSLSSITAPKLARRAVGSNAETSDEPWAWESREYLRKRLIGKEVFFSVDKAPSASREYGTILIGDDPNNRENINESLVKEGLVTVRGDNTRAQGPELQRLHELQEAAKSAHKGRFDNGNPTDHVRKITWGMGNNAMMSFVDKHEGKPIKAVIENVRDGSTIRAFLLFDSGKKIPDCVYISLMMSGIRCPSAKLDAEGKPDTNAKVEFLEEAKFFTESRLLQNEVDIILDSVNGSFFVGTIIHPKGNIAEELLKNGLAHCVDWSLAKMRKGEADKLRQAERTAKEKRLKRWKDWTPPPQINDREFTGTVIEVMNGDALNVKLPNGNVKKIFLASIRPPKEQPVTDENGPKTQKPVKGRPLYDVPWLFEAREFLRKKLVGKKVNVTVDYIQPARDNYPEKICCTVTVSSVNVAEAMVSKGLATVIRYRQNDDQRASAYDSLLSAEMKASKSQKGVFDKKDSPVHRVNDCCGDVTKAKNILPHLSRIPKIEAIVEYVTSGTRLRLYLPKESSLITFLLSGIEVKNKEGITVEEAATQFTREKCMQRDVEVKVESIDRGGNFIGWLWVDNVNLSVALVEQGLAKIHFSGENSEYSRQLNNAKNNAQAKGLWKFVEEEPKEIIEEEKNVERRVDLKEVVITEVSENSFYCQLTAHESKFNNMQAMLEQEMGTNPPLPGSYTPKKGDLCAAKFVDGNWYRAKVEKVSGNKVSVHYVDFGNKHEVTSLDCAQLPGGLTSEKPFSQCYYLAYIRLPGDPEYRKEAEDQLRTDLLNNKFLMNYEYIKDNCQYCTLFNVESKDDIGKKLVSEGLALVETRRERKLVKMVQEYTSAEEQSKNMRKNIWEYGDIREDDDKEFGLGR